ncbi:unnamed protein product [Effrenium voratum]|uniref:ATP-grasp domain-containing protein n=1 Tax=Effrenium voratum TaxID=2562239 RepID=A0AA36MRU6_9DINO|nr:unnamed protein product [Effrenium voratum]CAJ1417025.1 unnamed protein product [Effrenium voratum]
MGCGTGKPAAVSPLGSPVCTVVPTKAADAKPVAVVLPGGYAKQIMEDSPFTYHILDDPNYNMGNVMGFDADRFVEEAIKYCRTHGIKGVFGFDCFPSLLASIINTALQLPGPSFLSVFHCVSKYYMRKALTPEVKVGMIDPKTCAKQVPPNPEEFPLVVKETDCQFYIGTWIVHSKDEWVTLMEKLSSRDQKLHDQRKQFYFKWFQQLHPQNAPEARWEDFVLYHSEPYFAGREHQIEIVVDNGKELVADTGDMIKVGDILGMFVTPGSFEMPKVFAHDITKKLYDMGYNNQALDLEFIFTESGPQLVEINSRYSYMGFRSWYEVHGTHAPAATSQLASKPCLRNLENRTRSCLGEPVPKFPSDSNVISKLAVAVFTNKTGPVKDIVDLDYLEKVVQEGKAECWVPKPAFKAGVIKETDLSYGEGNVFCKLGFIMMTAKRTDFEATNAAIRGMFKNIFREADSYLLVQDDEIGYEVDKNALLSLDEAPASRIEAAAAECCC